MKADYPGICGSCDHPYRRGDRIVPRKGSYIHASCAPGADD